MPFIILHILSVAQELIAAESLAPVLLAFTRRHENDRVKEFYENLGFENTGVSLSYGGDIQDVFCLDITAGAPMIKRLQALTKRVNL
jgi:ribosomal protein S18 acetylase RimI-like enzyme